MRESLRRTLEGRLESFERWPAETPPERRRGHAAVAVAILGERPAEPAFILTQRAFHLAHHPGQYALPGGKIEEGETVEEAALREMEEEVGVHAGSAKVLGLLDDFATRSGFVMTPVVFWLHGDPELTPDPAEVHAVHRVPWSALEREDVPVLIPIPESDRPVLSLPLVDTLVFAPTAAIIYQAHEVLFQGRETRVAHYEQPVFAWK